MSEGSCEVSQSEELELPPETYTILKKNTDIIQKIKGIIYRVIFLSHPKFTISYLNIKNLECNGYINCGIKKKEECLETTWG